LKVFTLRKRSTDLAIFFEAFSAAAVADLTLLVQEVISFSI